MNKMRILSLHLENFMTYACQTFDFGRKMTISGRNAAGKSSICNAYTWLLFNTDMDGNDNPDIRREVDGKYIEDADVSVTGVFEIDGRTVTMQKTQKRKYNNDDHTKYADTNSYLINDVPKTLKEFNAFLSKDTSSLRACSNINAFLEKKDKEVREILFATVKNVTDRQIAERAGLLQVAQLLESYSRDEIEAMNKKVKRDVEQDLPVIKGQIAEKERDISIKAGFDTAELELAKKDLQERLEENQKAQTGVDEIRKKHSEAMDRVMQIKFEMSKIADAESQKIVDRRRELERTEDKCQYNITDFSTKISKKEREIAEAKAEIKQLEAERSKLASDWERVNALTMDEEYAICSMCKQPLPAEEVEKHRKSFETCKKQKLDKIESRGAQIVAELSELSDNLKRQDEYIGNAKKAVEVNQIRLNDVLKEKSELAKTADLSNSDEYKNLIAELSEAEKEVESLSSFTGTLQSLKNEEMQLRTELQDVCDKITSADSTADEARLDDLKDLLRKKEQVKADAECILDGLKELDKAKNELLSSAINAQFDVVDWKLWELNKSGGYKSVCIPMVDGKSILSIKSNKGNRILGRLDICNSLQKIMGIECPIWMDDCENLDKDNRKKAADMVDGQLIMLVVSDEEELKMEEQ